MSQHDKEVSHAFGAARPDRWMVEITYLDGTPAATFVVEELEEIDPIVELGPDWNTIDRIVVTLNRPTLTPVREV